MVVQSLTNECFGWQLVGSVFTHLLQQPGADHLVQKQEPQRICTTLN